MSGELDRLVAGCLLPGFPGLEPPDWIRRWIDRGLGGVVLYARNVGDPDQLHTLTSALLSERPDLLIATDEEGGDVTRLEAARGSSYPGNYALGTVDDVALTGEVAAAIGSDLMEAGVNLDLAPVADVNTNPRNPVIGVRSFGSDAELVARHVTAFVSGLQRAGVAACAKHFPGHGDTAQDSHLELPVVDTLEEDAVLPFRAAIDAGVKAIMTAHIVVQALGETPATLSRPILHDLLRMELAFRGAVITDALEMRAISGTVGVEEGAVRALAAGADGLCLGHDLAEPSLDSIRREVAAAVRSGRLDEARVREAADRVASLGRWVAGATSAPADRTVGLRAARRALRVEGDVRLDRPPLVVELYPDPSIAAGETGYGLGDALASREPATRALQLREQPATPASVVEDGRPLVVVVRDGHQHEWERGTVEALLAAAGGVVVETGLPVWRPSNATGYIATNGAGRVNLDAAAERLLERT